MLEEIKKEVITLLKDKAGHGFDHIERVLNLSLIFCEKLNADSYKVSLIALLHDIDDYKLFGLTNSKTLKNANAILDKYQIDSKLKKEILDEIKRIGYSKRLDGICPITIEGKIVSDADMCDALGVNGILRSYDYSKSCNVPFFRKDIFPNLNMDSKTYRETKTPSCVNHFFEKLLKLKNLMLTEPGYNEALERHNFMVSFLKNYFKEINALDWLNYLDDFLNIK